MQKSFWWRHCSDRYIISLSSHLRTPFPTFSPSLISRTVSVDVKHHVYLLTLSTRGYAMGLRIWWRCEQGSQAGGTCTWLPVDTAPPLRPRQHLVSGDADSSPLVYDSERRPGFLRSRVTFTYRKSRQFPPPPPPAPLPTPSTPPPPHPPRSLLSELCLSRGFKKKKKKRTKKRLH